MGLPSSSVPWGGVRPAAGGWDCVTVHSSPYAVEVYRHLGFSHTAEEQLSPDGIRYTPMIWEQ